MIQSQIFGIFKMLFDMPACATGRNHLWQRGPFRGKDEVVGFLVGISQAAPNEQPMTLIIFPSMQQRYASPVEEPGAFASLTHREALPILGSKQERFHLCCFHPPANPIRSHDPDWFIASDRQHVRIAPVFQPGAQVQIASIDRICHHPSNRYLGIPQTRQHASGQFRFRLEANRGWDPSRLTPITVLCPVQGQVEFAVNEGMPFGRHI